MNYDLTMAEEEETFKTEDFPAHALTSLQWSETDCLGRCTITWPDLES